MYGKMRKGETFLLHYLKMISAEVVEIEPADHQIFSGETALSGR